MGGLLRTVLPNLRAREFFPLGCGSECLEVLKGATGQSHVGSPNNAPKIYESFVIDLILDQQCFVIAEVPEKPIEFPQSPLCAVEPPGERASFERDRLQNNETDPEERFLWVPTIRSPFHSNEK